MNSPWNEGAKAKKQVKDELSEKIIAACLDSGLHQVDILRQLFTITLTLARMLIEANPGNEELMRSTLHSLMDNFLSERKK